MPKSSRKNIKDSVRFEVFKRDKFACQYCGRTAPDVTLVIDHIEPVKEGGTNDIMNLVTACRDCNSGKSCKRLSDDSVIKKQRQQLEELDERRNQLLMMVKWREELKGILEEQIIVVFGEFFGRKSEYGFSEECDKQCETWIKKFGLQEVLDAVDVSKSQYLCPYTGELNVPGYYEIDGKPYTTQSVMKAWEYVGRICGYRKKYGDDPTIKDLLYVRKIASNRCQYYFNDFQAMSILKQASAVGVPTDALRELACTINNWSQFRHGVEELIQGYGG